MSKLAPPLHGHEVTVATLAAGASPSRGFDLTTYYGRMVEFVPAEHKAAFARVFSEAVLASLDNVGPRSEILIGVQRIRRLEELRAMLEGTAEANPAKLVPHFWALSQEPISRGEDLALFQELEQLTRRLSDDIESERQDSIAKIIWQASARVDEWLAALRVATPAHQRWLVTALITRTIAVQGERARDATGGTTSAAAPSLIPAAQQEALLRLLSVSKDEDVRAEVMYALGEAGGSLAVSPLIRIIAADPCARMRSRAAVALGRIGGARAVKALMRAAAEDPDEWTRRFAVNSLRNLLPTGSERSTTAIRQVLEQVAQTEETPVTREIARQGLEDYATRPA